ncbi:MAG: serine acetyltransferase [Prevotellaceae bacterium]|jgi:serine O-acetyltransferase|nr:serine acetyltransferase [Prevotellaceae bacterium]
MNPALELLMPAPDARLATSAAAPPNIDTVSRLMQLAKAIIFPDYFGLRSSSEFLCRQRLESDVEQLCTLLEGQVAACFGFFASQGSELQSEAVGDIALRFVARLHEVKRMLYSDVDAVYNGDPAATSHGEVIFCYPAINAMLHYRVAHELLLLGVPVLPRIITELAHAATGIDIHPGANIGERFAIDHGTGVVIGSTCIIGSGVKLYQGITLGARSFTIDSDGLPVDLPRHPIIEDNVVVYANTTILGRITVGHDSVIGGNVWLVHSVPPHSHIAQRPQTTSKRPLMFEEGEGI